MLPHRGVEAQETGLVDNGSPRVDIGRVAAFEHQKASVLPPLPTERLQLDAVLVEAGSVCMERHWSTPGENVRWNSAVGIRLICPEGVWGIAACSSPNRKPKDLVREILGVNVEANHVEGVFERVEKLAVKVGKGGGPGSRMFGRRRSPVIDEVVQLSPQLRRSPYVKRQMGLGEMML
ncbi:unnamed protein product [Soboliphyme baturini]|uniref:DUF5641 domain-containing protein n=1 Tax=Soboliphyme baturini TaxID=241478 RepID=A0A183I9I9_9BILA|nr:unnamed protein product [Soboliphyme baturini]